MDKDIVAKIRSILDQYPINEDQIRSLMILLRKRMELMAEAEKVQCATLNLFCNWVAHTRITQSQTGLKTLRRINDTLVSVKDSTDIKRVQLEMSEAIGFDILRVELLQLLDNLDVKHRLADKRIWAEFLANIIEIIRDVPLSFPQIAKLKGPALKIYAGIAKNPIKPGAGVVQMTISKVNYDAFGTKGIGDMLCLLVKTEDTTTIVVPLIIEV